MFVLFYRISIINHVMVFKSFVLEHGYIYKSHSLLNILILDKAIVFAS